jgi:hypothetical protein
MSLTPPLFTSGYADGSDATKFRPSDLNRITGLLTSMLGTSGATGGLLFRDSASSNGFSWIEPAAAGKMLISGGSAASATWSDSLPKIIVGAGLVSAPSITFLGDTDTGWWSPAAGVISLACDAVERLRIATNFRMPNDMGIAWSSNADVLNSDTWLLRDAANTLAQRNGTNGQRLNLGQGNTALAAGRLAMGRDASAAFAPGAGYGMLRWETGTNANTLKLVAYSGTSTVGTTVIDNVGGGN